METGTKSFAVTTVVIALSAVAGFLVGLLIVGEVFGGIWTAAGGALMGWALCRRVVTGKTMASIVILVVGLWLLLWLGKSGAFRPF